MSKSMSLNAAGGALGLLKNGYQHFSGTQEAVLRNTEAVQSFAKIIQTSMGPNGMNKMVINHLDKLFVTSDAATIVNELEVQHPAARMLMMAAQQQQIEFGDGTGFVMAFCGDLMQRAEELIKIGIPTTDIVKGYKIALEYAKSILPELALKEPVDVRDKASLLKALKPVIAAKQYGFEDTIAPLVTDACQIVMPTKASGKKPSIYTDSIRVCKMLGGNITQCRVIRGMIVQRESLTNVKNVKNAKVALFQCPVEAASTEAKSTVLISNADDLVNYNRSEEAMMDANIKAIKDSGADVIISGGSVSEMAQHFIQKYEMMVFKIVSKWELRRLARALNCKAIPRLGAVSPDEMGSCDVVETVQIGGRNVTVFRQEGETGRVASIVLRSSTKSSLDDLERAVGAGVNTAKTLCAEARLLAGAGAIDIELGARIQAHANTRHGLEQYAIRKFGEAFEVVPRMLAENAGMDVSELLSKLYSAHAEGKLATGVDIEKEATLDAEAAGIFDSYGTKFGALCMSADAAITVLRVDQIIMAKQAGGPKPGEGGGRDDD